jgi:uncharacterized protein YyaL (SSP411 family)
MQMKSKISLLGVGILALSINASAHAQASPQAQPPPSTPLRWLPWSNSVFEQARAEHKFLLLDLEAVWCHWCHVMDDVTYRDPTVDSLLEKSYLLVKVDQDARPDISNRYQDYGWPATVVFAADGSEIVKRQGYMPPRQMASMLQAIIDDPSPGPSVEKAAAFEAAASASMDAALLKRVQAAYDNQYDKPVAGWGFGHKYLDGDSVEFALRLAAGGDAVYAERTADTLHAATALLDPAWGGMYQYSVGGHWSEPHFEKLISIQATAMKQYSLAYAQTGNVEDLHAAESVDRYVTDFLSSPEGTFYVSQDADLHDGEENEPYFALADKERRALGVPRIDKHEYARENGWMIAALCDYYAASGDGLALQQAQRAARWIGTNRSLPGGGFRHDQTDAAGPYLGDTLAMGQAFLALYNVTADREALTAAAAAADFIAGHFAPAQPGAGFVTSIRATDSAYPPHPDRDENGSLVRFTAMLALATGDEKYRTSALEAMRYLAAPQIALTPLSAGVLLANQDADQAPIHVAVVGTRSSRDQIALHDAALRSITSHELIEIRDPADPAPLPTSVQYPKLDHAALYLCTANACSLPIVHPADVHGRVLRAEINAVR